MKSRGDAGFGLCFLVMAAPGVTKAVVAVANKTIPRPTTAVTRQDERHILKMDCLPAIADISLLYLLDRLLFCENRLLTDCFLLLSL
jgi:hypothetical protein